MKLKFAKTFSLSDSGVEKGKENLPTTVDVQDLATATGGDLIQTIKNLLPDDHANKSLRLISGGKVLESEKCLREQGVNGPGKTVMVLKLDPKTESLKIVEEQRRILESTKNDADLLGEDNDDRASGRSLTIAGKTF